MIYMMLHDLHWHAPRTKLFIPTPHYPCPFTSLSGADDAATLACRAISEAVTWRGNGKLFSCCNLISYRADHLPY